MIKIIFTIPRAPLDVLTHVNTASTYINIVNWLFKLFKPHCAYMCICMYACVCEYLCVCI